MLFNSIEFIIFLILVIPIYYALPHKFRWFHLLAASCLFYMAFVPIYILILFGTIVVDYFAGILIEKTTRHKKLFLVVSLIANIGVLAIFKYYNFFIETINHATSSSFSYLSILLPIGLSFHTFQAMSYTIEVYRGNQKAERHFGIYALYVMFYPQLVAGPIERPQNILHQFHQKHSFSVSNFVWGGRLFLWGMFKKVVIADRLALFVNQVYDHHTDYIGVPLLLAAFFFSFQIFFDFSGYTDIALGCARMMGFTLMENFNRPYSATSIKAFWSKWHISLSTWFRDYLYIPLGGSKVSVNKWLLNIFIVFIISGFWHGANWTFIIWGALHGLYQIGEILIQRRVKENSFPKFINRSIVFILVMFAWIFFRAETIDKAFYFFRNSFNTLPSQVIGLMKNQNLERLKLVYLNQETYQFYFAVVLLIFVSYIHRMQKKMSIPDYFGTMKSYYRWPLYFFLLYSVVFLGVYEKYQFIYFQF